MEIAKSTIICVVGRPNVGKSTLVNSLVGNKVAIVSDKPQTTRTRITGVRSRGECQFVFLDTPGFHKPKSFLGDFMVKVVSDSVSDVDTVCLVVEPFAKISDSDMQLIEKIKKFKMPGVLAINKIDTVKKDRLLEVISVYSKAHQFDAVVPISAKTGEAVDTLLDEFEKFSLESPALFPEGVISDQPERQIVAEVIREKALMRLDKEIPHGIAVGIETMRENDKGILNIDANIYCEKTSHKGIIIGKNGQMLKSIASDARIDLEEMFEIKVFLQVWVKIKEGWRNNMYQMRNFGYQD